MVAMSEHETKAMAAGSHMMAVAVMEEVEGDKRTRILEKAGHEHRWVHAPALQLRPRHCRPFCGRFRIQGGWIHCSPVKTLVL